LAAVGNNIRLTGGGPHADLTLLADTVPIAGAQLDPLYWETIKRLWSEHSQSIYEVSDEVVTAYKVAEKQASESLKKVGFRRGKVRRSVQRVRFS
jgi:organic radical activating enzyme